MASIENGVGNVIDILPSELASKLDFLIVLIQALGGLFILYLIFFVIRFYFLKRQTKLLKEIQKDVVYIKNKLKKEK